MVVCILKNIKSQTRIVLTSYLYEVQVNVFVGVLNYKLSQDILNGLKEKVQGKEQAIFISSNKKAVEGFDIQYINCPNRKVDFDGLTLFLA